MNKEKFTLFWSGPFSQWHNCEFVDNKFLTGDLKDSKFNCAEQYMMLGKALKFFDYETAQRIMRSTSPKEQKKLGRQVKNFDPVKWDEVARDIVYMGNYLKFTQNKDLLKLLLDTKGTTLVEASPFDTIWGIGLAEDNPLAQDRSTWKGTNWLGEVLTKLREDLINAGN